MYRVKFAIEVDLDGNGVYQGIRPGDYSELPLFITPEILKKQVKNGNVVNIVKKETKSEVEEESVIDPKSIKVEKNNKEKK